MQGARARERVRRVACATCMRVHRAAGSAWMHRAVRPLACGEVQRTGIIREQSRRPLHTMATAGHGSPLARVVQGRDMRGGAVGSSSTSTTDPMPRSGAESAAERAGDRSLYQQHAAKHNGQGSCKKCVRFPLCKHVVKRKAQGGKKGEWPWSRYSCIVRAASRDGMMMGTSLTTTGRARCPPPVAGRCRWGWLW
jgi:hypothetical protein